MDGIVWNVLSRCCPDNWLGYYADFALTITLLRFHESIFPVLSREQYLGADGPWACIRFLLLFPQYPLNPSCMAVLWIYPLD